jgi:hypothetical protein
MRSVAENLQKMLSIPSRRTFALLKWQFAVIIRLIKGVAG